LTFHFNWALASLEVLKLGLTDVVGSMRLLLRPALLAMLMSLGIAVAMGQGVVDFDKLPGKPIDKDWFHYINQRYGLSGDIPAAGFVYELGDLGDELSMTSVDGEKTITVYGSQDVDPNLRGNNLSMAFAALAAAQIDAMRLGGIEVTLEHVDPLSFEVGATDASYLYYQKGIISENCPTLTANLWIKYPVEDWPAFEDVVKRMSTSLSMTCAAE
jgi:hypothetical protein